MAKRTTQKIINNFIEKYGKERFRWFINAIATGVSGQVIADEFDVSRERVRQWKEAFGEPVVVYQLKPETKIALGMKKGKLSSGKIPIQARSIPTGKIPKAKKEESFWDNFFGPKK